MVEVGFELRWSSSGRSEKDMVLLYCWSDALEDASGDDGCLKW